MRPGHAYLSAPYEQGNRRYDFNNIAQIVTEHLAKHAAYTSSGGWIINTPLSLDLIPVTVTQNGSNTASIAEQIAPSFVRLSKARDAMRLTFVSVEIKQ